MKKLVLSIMAFMLVMGCTRSVNSSVALVVDIEKNLSEEVSFGDLFANKEVIVLDNEHPIDFGLYSESQKWIISDNGFFFLTEKGVIVHYDLNGNFIGEYDKRGRGHGEYLLSYACRLEEKSKVLTILDPRGSLFHYSVKDSLEFIRQDVLPEVLAVHNMFRVDNDWLLYSCTEKQTFRMWNGTSMKDIGYNPHCNIKYAYNAPEPFILDCGQLYYFEGFSGNIFCLNDEHTRMEKLYYWDFGKHTSNAVKENFKKIDFAQYLKGSSYEKIFPFLNMLKVNNLIYADVLFHNEEHSLFYNIATGESKFFQSFKEGYKFKASKVWNGSLYLVVESDCSDDYGVKNLGDGQAYVIKYNLR